MQREPDIVGAYGKAWRSRVELLPAEKASLATWIVERPGAHPAWSNWLVGLCHLRPMDGVQPAVKRYPEAEFELLVMALDPGFPLDVDDAATFHTMTPFDLVFQFHGLSDGEAVRFVERYHVRSIVDAGASPDSDFRSWWEGALAAALKYSKWLS